jgi:hypothetical protein
MVAVPSGVLHGRDPFRIVHVAALALCVVMLPWSKPVLSMAQLLLVLNWLAEGAVRNDLVGRLRRVFTNAPAAVFLSFLGLYVLGLLWSTDKEWGVDLVRTLLPVVSFGVVLAGSRRLDVLEFRTVLLLGAWSVVISTVVCMLLRVDQLSDYRSLSVFISHIRLALLLCLAVVVFLLDRTAPVLLRFAGYAAVLWCLAFINLLGSIQGYIILLLISAVAVWRALEQARPRVRAVLRSLLCLVPLALVLVGMNELRRHSRLPDPQLAERGERTAGGELYMHDLHNPQKENGTFVWTYLAWGELRTAWPQRSERSMDALDDKGHPVWGTVVRYLASKGLRKDSASVMALSDEDVDAIERGIPNFSDRSRNALYRRMNEVVFELQHYYAYGAADGHSVAMRLEFLKVGSRIAKRHWVTGVGTGDTKQAFAEEYERMGSMLSPQWRHRAHNQYLTLWVSFGIFGLLWSLFAWYWPARRTGAWGSMYFIAWAVIFGVSCLSDDTIETQVGATFFALYYGLFVFAAPTSRTSGASAGSQ